MKAIARITNRVISEWSCFHQTRKEYLLLKVKEVWNQSILATLSFSGHGMWNSFNLKVSPIDWKKWIGPKGGFERSYQRKFIQNWSVTALCNHFQSFREEGHISCIFADFRQFSTIKFKFWQVVATINSKCVINASSLLLEIQSFNKQYTSKYWNPQYVDK